MLIRKPLLLYMPDGDQGGDGADTQDTHSKTYSEDEFKKVVEQRQELKTKIAEYESRIAELESKIKSAEDAELEKKGETQKLLENTKAELESIRLERDSFKAKADEWDGFLTSEREKIKNQFGDKWKESYSKLPLEDLKDLAESLKTKTSDTDNGGPAAVKLTDLEKTEAERMGLSEEGYLAYKKRRKELKGE